MAKKKKTKVKTSYTQILNIGYGVLNPIRDTLTGKNFDSSDVSNIDLIRNMYKSFYSANTFAGTGPYVGIVLRDEGMTSDGIVDASSWVSGPFSHHIRIDDDVDGDGSTSSEGGVAKEKVVHLPQLRQLRVRVPEIHASLPIPSYLPTVAQSGADFDTDHRIINQYPVFVGQNSRISSFEPMPGDLVWVDFQNKNTLEGGIYMGPVDQGATNITPSSKGTTVVGGGKEAFDKEKCIEEGGVGCEVVAPTLNEEDGSLEIRPGKPFLPSGFNLDLVTFIGMKVDEKGGKEGTNFSQLKGMEKKSDGSFKKGTDKKNGYKDILNNRSKFVKNRPIFLGYGLMQAHQTSNAYGSNGVHKLVATRLDALNAFWGHFYRAFTESKFGDVTPDTFKYRQARGAAALKPYSEKFEVSRGMIKPTWAENTPSKIKKYLESSVRKKTGTKESPAKINFIKKTYPGMSNHATGLAIDFKNNGMDPGGDPKGATYYGYDTSSQKSGRKHIPQYASIGWKFMAKYGWLFGFYAYNTEAWHWELKPPRSSWFTGQEYCNEGVYVKANKSWIRKCSVKLECHRLCNAY